MTTGNKPDADRIIAAVDELCEASWLQGHQRFWPRYVYHSADVRNAAKILASGQLLSRNRAVLLDLLEKDSAAPGIVGDLGVEEKDFVRLYFRPRVPTQHANEGIRPVSGIQYGGHMPVPVYLLFWSRDVLALTEARFTQGRFTRIAHSGTDADYLAQIDFKRVFHDAAFKPTERDAIVEARHSEVLIPNALSLDYLRWIICRSAPERETLLNLVDDPTRKPWEERIILEGRNRLFFKRGTFVEAVTLASTHSHFKFFDNCEPDFRGPFSVKVQWDDGKDWNAAFTKDDYYVRQGVGRFNFSVPRPSYTVRVELNGDLAYLGRFLESGEPELL